MNRAVRFEVSTGTWHRVDAQGTRIPFQDPAKENTWRNFKRVR